MSKKKKSENRKALPEFLGIVFLATLGGGIAGGCIGFFGGMMTPDHIVESIRNIVETIAPYGVWIITLLFTALELRLYLKARALYQSWDGEDEEIIELYNYRELLKTSIRKEIRGRYKGSLLGVLWSFINPLLQVAVYAIVFPYLMGNTGDHYLQYLITGIIQLVMTSLNLVLLNMRITK